MPSAEHILCGYQIVWLFAMFDLPVDTKAARKAYAQFRNLLLANGFSQMQYSVYARCCDGEDRAKTFRERIRRALPDDGHVRVLSVTDVQFGKMEVYLGKKRAEPESRPVQLELF